MRSWLVALAAAAGALCVVSAQAHLGQGASVVKCAFVRTPPAPPVELLATANGVSAIAFALSRCVSAASRGLKMNRPQSHGQEREMFEAGKHVFFFRMPRFA